MAKTASNQLGICLRIMHVRPVPKVSIFMAVTTKKVTEKAQKWAKMARFWPKMRYNGRVMAREIFFYHCLWVTKFCVMFGRSRIPRKASAHNSFIVLRCVVLKKMKYLRKIRIQALMSLTHAQGCGSAT